MTVATLDRIAKARKYKELVNHFPPRPIRERKSLKAAYSVIDRIMDIPNPSADQLEFLELLSTLVENYEAGEFPTPAVPLPSLLSHLFESKAVTQAEVARATGMSPSTLSEVLAGKRSLSIANVKRLAKFFGVDTSLLIESMAD